MPAAFDDPKKMKRFLFYVPGVTAPTGGVSVILDWVRVLRANGFQADVFSDTPGYRYEFSNSDIDILYCAEVERLRKQQGQNLKGRMKSLGTLGFPKKRTLARRDGDVVVVPEFAAGWLPRAFPGHRHVLLVQAFSWFGDRKYLADLKKTRFDAVVATSEICEGYSRLAGLGPVHRIPVAIDGDVFFPRPKRDVICYMPRRRANDIDLVVNALNGNGGIDGFSIQAIDRVPLEQVAEILGRARMFLSFSEREGFGLPPAEAMASGCLVIGFTGGGGDEYFDPSWSFPISDGNLPRFVETIRTVAASCRDDPERMQSMARTAAEMVSSRYRPDAQRRALLDAFGHISEMVPAGRVPS